MSSTLRQESPLPPPPPFLQFREATLCFLQMLAGEPAHGIVPAYHFRLLTAQGAEAGFLNFRVGHTPHVELYVGHIGYEVREPFRGRGLAWQACRAAQPFVAQLYSSVIITCDPDNTPSRRTIERLGAAFLEEIDVPPSDPQYAQGSRHKRRYRWSVREPQRTP